MNQRKLGSFVLCAILFAILSSAEAQQAAKVPRLGYLSGGCSHGVQPRGILARLCASLVT